MEYIKEIGPVVLVTLGVGILLLFIVLLAVKLFSIKDWED
jgi:hypothetical protein